MTHDEIRQKFFNIQAALAGPDLVGYLEYDTDATVHYMRDKLKNPLYTVSKYPFPSKDFLPNNEYTKNASTIFFPMDESPFNKRARIALGLAEIVLFHSTAELHGVADENIKFNLSAFYAQLLLRERAVFFGADNNLRREYASSEDKIPGKIKELFPRYNEPALTEADKNMVKEKLKDVHGMIKDEGFLYHDTKLVSLYIEKTEKISFRITKKPSNYLIKKGKTSCYAKACNLWYPIGEDSLTKRLLIAHELGNIACHRQPGQYVGNISNETDDERKEATYFAKILLEYRAELYLGNKESPLYAEAKKEIEQAIKRLYLHMGDEWLDWVIRN